MKTKHIIAKNNRDLMLLLIPSKNETISGMVTDPNDMAFDYTLKQNGFSEVDKFYEWMKGMGNKHLDKHEEMTNAFNKIKNN